MKHPSLGVSFEGIWHPLDMKIVALVNILREETNAYILEFYGNDIYCHITCFHSIYMKVVVEGSDFRYWSCSFGLENVVSKPFGA